MSDRPWSLTDSERFRVEEVGREIAHKIKRSLKDSGVGKKIGFVLCTYTYEPGFISWISSGDRPGTIKALRELADAMEKGADEKPMGRNTQ